MQIIENSSTQAESLPHSLELAVGGLHVNANKTEYISTVNGGSLKLVEKFTYLCSCVSSTEYGIQMHLANAWTGIDWLIYPII